MRTTAQPPWWMHPALTFAGVQLVAGGLALTVSPRLCIELWAIPKYFTDDSFNLLLMVVAAFAVGATVASAARVEVTEESSFRPPPGSTSGAWRLLRFLFEVAFWLTLIGYVVWLAVSIKRGLRPQMLMGVLTGNAGALGAIRAMTETVPGATTLTQCGIAAVVFGMIKGAAQGWSTVKRRLQVLFALALVRALFHSERIALLELLIPATLLWLHLRNNNPEHPRSFRSRVTQAFAPVLAAGLIFGCFVTFEYFRSWSHYKGAGDSLVEFGAQRLGGYYVTSLNNGALFLEQVPAPLPVPYYTLEWLWKFPVIGDLIGYRQWAGMPPPTETFKNLLAMRANIEFNSRCGTFVPFLDFGTVGGLMFWAFAGAIIGVAYRYFAEGHMAGLVFFPVLYLGLLESPRILYWCEGRTFPVWLIMLPVAFIAFRGDHRRRQDGSH